MRLGLNMSSDILPPFHIERARAEHVPLILTFIRELAEYERLSDHVVATEAGLRRELFGPQPIAEVLLGFEGKAPVGFALFFHNFSTFLGQRGIYLEDLFVRPSARGRGYGKALLRGLARIAVERQAGRLEWAVLDWNAPAIGFYESLGAEAKNEWKIFRLTGDSLQRLAEDKTS
jgi:GNAT superfamily N-acetyltransferase